MSQHEGFEAFLRQPFFETLWSRRTHRVHRGVRQIAAGSMTYHSDQPSHPLSEEEEAILIAATGCTGLTMPDRPFEERDANGKVTRNVPAKPSLTLSGRTAGSPDNAQATHFFMFNDSGTYYLRNLPADPGPPTLEALVARAHLAKVQLFDRRLDVPEPKPGRDFPAYLDSNRFLSNKPGTTVFVPVVDYSAQYINGLMYILTQPDGFRPTLVDDRNFYRLAGVKKWVKNKFLNENIKLPLGSIAGLRTQIEADLLLQNVFLTAEAIGLGGWIHATIAPLVLLGDPRYVPAYGKMLGFHFHTPKWRLLDILRWSVFLPRFRDLRTHPTALIHQSEPLIRGKCPPHYPTMSAAVDDVLKAKDRVYSDEATFARIFKEDFGVRFRQEAKSFEDDVKECVRDVCEYIYKTHDRFPAHVDAIHVPGVWLQVNHPDQVYYDRYFHHGLTRAQREHDHLWHCEHPRPPSIGG